MLKQVPTEQNLINGEWKILKNLIRRLLMFQNIQKLSKLKMFKGLDMIRALTAYHSNHVIKVSLNNTLSISHSPCLLAARPIRKSEESPKMF